ncbi:MAG: Gfo/Idh/MocA family oxidoreductase [Ruminococcaceae bacterium]|nr:Gfo/Idh/MocA family oxidoreductase [Oscillospiraceae bacterium]
MDKVRFGIVGCGNMGTGHAKNFLAGKIENAYISAVCDIDPERFEFFKENFGDTVKYYDNAEEMCKSGECDAIIICVPHYQHPELAILAMDSGLHCIVEKPAGVYTLQVKEMLERHKTSDKILGIMFNQRTNPIFKKMRQMILDGQLGEIKRTNWIITNWYRTQEYYDSGSWRATWAGEGGGVLYNQAPHNLDLFQWIVGMMPSKVHAFCHFGKWHDIEVEDDVTCYCEYPNGATGVFITTTADAPGTNRFEVTGTKGTLIMDYDQEKNEFNLFYRELEVDERVHCLTEKGGFKRPPVKPTVKIEVEEDNPQHVGICNNIANAILGLEEVYAPAEDGLCGVQLANAMLLSTWLNKAIDIPFDDELFYEELKKRIAISKPHEVKSKKVEAQN